MSTHEDRKAGAAKIELTKAQKDFRYVQSKAEHLKRMGIPCEINGATGAVRITGSKKRD